MAGIQTGGVLPPMQALNGTTGEHKAFAYGLTRTARLIDGVDQEQLVAYEALWRDRLLRHDRGTTAYSVALGAWTAVINRGSIPGFGPEPTPAAKGSEMVEG